MQGSCLSTLLCSIFLADLEFSHLQTLLPHTSWHPSARICSAHFYAHPNPTSSSAARLTDLAQAAGASMCNKHRNGHNECTVFHQQSFLSSQQSPEVSKLHSAAPGVSCLGLHIAFSLEVGVSQTDVASAQPITAPSAEASLFNSIPDYNGSCFTVLHHHQSPPAVQINKTNHNMTDDPCR